MRKTWYAMMAGYRVLDEGGALDIHCMLFDAAGNVVRRIEITRHDEVLVRAQPKTVEDCTRLLLSVIDDRMKRERGLEPTYKAAYEPAQ